MLVLFLIKITVIIITFEHHRCSDDSGKLILTEVKDGPLLQVIIMVVIMVIRMMMVLTMVMLIMVMLFMVKLIMVMLIIMVNLIMVILVIIMFDDKPLLQVMIIV